jgi:hypothetical protein
VFRSPWRIHARRFSILLFLVALGCQQATAPSDRDAGLGAGDPERVLATEKESYPAGATASLRLTNPFRHALGYNLCHSLLERQSSGAWRTAEFENDRVCTMELRILQPGGTATYDLPLSPRLPAGDYRFRTSVENMSTGTREQVVSNTFPVTR